MKWVCQEVLTRCLVECSYQEVKVLALGGNDLALAENGARVNDVDVLCGRRR